jgi:hypothetical protein
MKNIKIIYGALVMSLSLASTQANTLSFASITGGIRACAATINDNRKPLIAVAMVYGAYKAYTYISKKYYSHMRAIALDESIRQYLTDEKIAEIARATNGLSNGDLQGIINKIKTYASITPDGRATQEIIDLAAKEYIDKHNTFKEAHAQKKA